MMIGSDSSPVLGHSRWVSTSIDPADVSQQYLFLRLLFVYVLLVSTAAASGFGIFRFFSNLFAVVFFLVMLVNWLFTKAKEEVALLISFSLLVYCVGIAATFLVVGDLDGLIEAAKLILAPLFVLFGFSSSRKSGQDAIWARTGARLYFAAILLLPMFAWLIQLGFGKVTFGAGQEVGPFANRNNAALFYIVMLMLFDAVSNGPIRKMYIYLFAGGGFGTLGAALAVVCSMLVCVGTTTVILRIIGLMASFLCVAYFVPDLLELSRVKPVVDSAMFLWSGRIDIRSSTYADLVLLLNTTDLSFIFRIKHWVNLFDVYMAGSLYSKLFGFGVGSSVYLSSAHLVPHNDYLRHLFELGLLPLVAFLLFHYSFVRKLGFGWHSVPYVAFLFYSFSENLMNNFLAMIVLYFSLGLLYMRREG